MASLTSALISSANALNTFEQTFSVIENNITNANTPGYARQDINLQPLPFDPASGLAGGVDAGPLINSRSEFLEQAVRDQQSQLGSAQQTASDLGQIQPLFDLTSTTGVASSINNFFNAFSQLSVNPNDALSRQSVINQAGTLAADHSAERGGDHADFGEHQQPDHAGGGADQSNRLADRRAQSAVRIRDTGRPGRGAGRADACGSREPVADRQFHGAPHQRRGFQRGDRGPDAAGDRRSRHSRFRRIRPPTRPRFSIRRETTLHRRSPGDRWGR